MAVFFLLKTLPNQKDGGGGGGDEQQGSSLKDDHRIIDRGSTSAGRI